jgi:hypothetical protein
MLRHWWNLLRASVRLTVAFVKAIGYFQHRAPSQLRLPADERLASGEKRRLKHYYYGTTYLAALFGSLHGRQRNPAERHLFLHLSALACFFDDLSENIRPEKVHSPEHYGHRADPRGLALHWLEVLRRDLPEHMRTDFEHHLSDVFEAEGHSVFTEDPEKLRAVMARKGSASVLLFRCLIEKKISAEENLILVNFGALIQFCDDIFDIWFDHAAGHPTLARWYCVANDLKTLHQEFENQANNTFEALKKGAPALPGSTTEARAIVQFLVAITRLCLWHYGNLQKKHGTLLLDNRAAMVLDMEKWPNRLRAAAYLIFRNT